MSATIWPKAIPAVGGIEVLAEVGGYYYAVQAAAGATGTEAPTMASYHYDLSMGDVRCALLSVKAS